MSEVESAIGEAGRKVEGKAAWTAAERRRHQRRGALCAGRLENVEGEHIGCVIIDFSDGGVQLLPEQFIPEGEILTLIAEPVGRRRGRIAWTGRTCAGLQFLGASREATAEAQRSSAKFLPF